MNFDSLYLGVIFSYPPFIVHSMQPTIAIWVYRSPKGTVVKTIGYENSMVVEPGFLHEVGTNFEIGKPLVGLSYCGIGEEGTGLFLSDVRTPCLVHNYVWSWVFLVFSIVLQRSLNAIMYL